MICPRWAGVMGWGEHDFFIPRERTATPENSKSAVTSTTMRPRISPRRILRRQLGQRRRAAPSRSSRRACRAADRGPGAATPRCRCGMRAHHRIDAEQIDAAQQERDHRRRQVAAAGEAAGGDAGAVFELRQDRRQRRRRRPRRPRRPSARCRAAGRACSERGAVDQLGGAEPFR